MGSGSSKSKRAASSPAIPSGKGVEQSEQRNEPSQPAQESPQSVQPASSVPQQQQPSPEAPEGSASEQHESGLEAERKQQLKELGQLPSLGEQRTGIYFIDTYPDVEWRESFEVGVDFVDSQHKVLVELLQTLNIQIREFAMCNVDKIGLENVLKDLKHYTEFHFREEEIMMEEYGWPGLEDHKKVHAEFVARVEEYRKMVAVDDVTIGHDVLDYLKDWLLTHIMYTDKKVCDFINEKKREREAAQQQLQIQGETQEQTQNHSEKQENQPEQSQQAPTTEQQQQEVVSAPAEKPSAD